MKQYNSENFDRFKKDLENKIGKEYFYLVESIARKFNTSSAAAGIFTLEDLIQEGVVGLLSACEKINDDVINSSEFPDKTLKSFLSKRIKGAIRRSLNINRSSIKIPEFKLNDLRNNPEDNEKLLQEYFNGSFLSIDNVADDEGNTYADMIEDTDDNFRKDRLNDKFIEMIKDILTPREFLVLSHSLGLGCVKLQAKEIAVLLGLKGKYNQIRVAEIKKESMDKLFNQLKYSQLIDLL
jgi:RNA polymerase sigma factor (sigma-70 family)